MCDIPFIFSIMLFTTSIINFILSEIINKKILRENRKLKKIITEAYSKEDILNLYNKNECNINALNYINKKTDKSGELVLLSDETKRLNEILKGE